MQKPKLDAAGRTTIPLEPSAFSESFPHLWEYLTHERYSDDNSLRLTSTLLIFVDAGVLKACFNDRDNNRSFFSSAATFEKLLEEIESRISNDTAEWKTKTSRPNGSDKIPW